MIQKVKKRTMFLIGLMVTGLLGSFGSYVKSNYSKEESAFISTAYADIQPWPTSVSNGDGSGGCSGDASY